MPIGTIIWRALLAIPLLSLFFIAFNFVGAIFWFAGFFILLVALSHLLKELPKSRRRKPLLVISLATVALFFGACANHGRALTQLSRETRAFAVEMHAHCNRDRVCPAAEKVCTPDAYGCREAGSLGLRLPIRYQVADDKQSFTASSSMASDDATSYAGGVARPLTRRFMVDGSDMNGEDAPPEVIVPYDAGIASDGNAEARASDGADAGTP